MVAFELDKYDEPIGRFSSPSQNIRVIDYPRLNVITSPLPTPMINSNAD